MQRDFKEKPPMHLSRRCMAKTRQGLRCKSPAVVGKKRCRMHGGAKGSGAQKGNQNAFKHGYYALEQLTWKKTIRKLMRDSIKMINKIFQ